MRQKNLILAAALSLIATSSAFAQQGAQNVQAGSTPVTVVGNAAPTTAENSAAVNNPVTVTLTPSTGQSVYLCGLLFTVSADGTAGDVWTNLSFTSTNLGGWAYTFSANTSTANQMVLDKYFTFTPCIKAPATTTPVTIVSPAAKTHGKYDITAIWYSGT